MNATPLLAFALTLCVAAAIHSWITRSAVATANLLGLLALFFVIKGCVDAGRAPTDFPYEMHLRWIELDGRHLGIHLLLFPSIRLGFAYTAVCMAERITAWSATRALRFWPMVSASIFSYGLLGVGLELINEQAGWWTWKESLGTLQFVHYLLTWIVWASGVFEALFVSFVPWTRVRHRWLLSIGILLGFYVVLIAVSMTVPFLRNPIFLPFAVVMMVVGVFAGGPLLRGLRQGELIAQAPR